MRILTYSTIESPFGTIWFAASSKGVSFLLLRYFNERRVAVELKKIRGAKLARDDRGLRSFAGQLERYFAGEVVPFEVELDLSSGTSFQQAVWRAVRKTAYGHLVSYKAIAEKVGNPLSARAVGNALGANPIPIVIPCHRVIRSDNSLGGFSGGIRWKRRLIGIELGQGSLRFTESG
ncbi:MAG: methylated-DNA--[protein]-cysteine S-methyltransferase [Candidatus Eisenbacteria bacterium]